MEQDILKKLDEQNIKLDAIALSVKKMRSYFFWTGVITIALFVIPLIGLVFVIPQFLNTYSSLGGSGF